MAMLKGTSKDESLRLILRELELDECLMTRKIKLFTHIYGVSNILPDHLSRFYFPTPHSVPPMLTQVLCDVP
ncbi:MAG: hypothetical protein ACKPKO_24965, partial [Candidatus Fonsibacter sp.]